VKQLFVFDLDGTLAPSKSSLSPEMAVLLADLLNIMKVAVISGGAWAQFESQLLAHLPTDARRENLFLLPTCGTQFFRYERGWEKLYSEDLTATERREIVDALAEAFAASGIVVTRTWGEVIEDRGSQITFSALGQDAPLAEKARWDPDFALRRRVAAILTPRLPDFAINMGGTTSIDVTKPGIDKAYGIAKLRDHVGIAVSDMLFAGDALFEGGNDFPAQRAGVDSLLVRDVDETARIIQTVIACLGDGRSQIVAPATAPARGS
jgi:HAD superfamily hydrolase (TIGR01484 family)